ncbi:MAG: 3'-5' exonuclease [Rhodobacteraceae bacterium]|nr:3'-5' exonuclease [Paracoccaceae bacterium]
MLDRDFLGLGEIIALDVETTGLDPKRSRIVSVAALKTDLSEARPSASGGVNITFEVFHEVFNPTVPIPKNASRIHGITDANVASKRTFAAAATELRSFIGDITLVAHNVRFDTTFLNSEFCRAGVTPISGNRTLCTMQAVHERIELIHGRGAKWPKLAECGPFVSTDISQSRRHSAMEDATNVLRIVIGLRSTFVAPGTHLVTRR